jgi:hypothetical protein
MGGSDNDEENTQPAEPRPQRIRQVNRQQTSIDENPDHERNREEKWGRHECPPAWLHGTRHTDLL